MAPCESYPTSNIVIYYFSHCLTPVYHPTESCMLGHCDKGRKWIKIWSFWTGNMCSGILSKSWSDVFSESTAFKNSRVNVRFWKRQMRSWSAAPLIWRRNVSGEQRRNHWSFKLLSLRQHWRLMLERKVAFWTSFVKKRVCVHLIIIIIIMSFVFCSAVF